MNRLVRVDLRVPELGLGRVPLVVGRWHKAAGSVVVQGDPLLEVIAGSVVVDLPAPSSGTLRERLVEPDQWLAVGQHIATIDADGD